MIIGRELVLVPDFEIEGGGEEGGEGPHVRRPPLPLRHLFPPVRGRCVRYETCFSSHIIQFNNSIRIISGRKTVSADDLHSQFITELHGEGEPNLLAVLPAPRVVMVPSKRRHRSRGYGPVWEYITYEILNI